MKQYLFAITLCIFTPALALAADPSLQKLFENILILFNTAVIPFLFGVAFLLFTINVIRYFVAGAGNKDDREKAKSVATYSVAAFVFLGIFWGIVNMLAESTGLEGEAPVVNDYVEMKTL